MFITVQHISNMTTAGNPARSSSEPPSALPTFRLPLSTDFQAGFAGLLDCWLFKVQGPQIQGSGLYPRFQRFSMSVFAPANFGFLLFPYVRL